jgi:co-chaperonin GroES (HSP10)
MIQKLLPKRVAIIPIRDPSEIDATMGFTKAEMDYIQKEGIQLKQGSIIIPEQAKERTDQGIIKYIGDDVRDLKVGDYVIFSGYSGTLFHFTGEGPRGEQVSEDLIIVHSDFIFGVLDEVPYTPVPGLYFKTRDPDNKVIYEPANYEVAVSLIRDAFRNKEWLSRIDIVTPKPKPEEYNVTRGG